VARKGWYRTGSASEILIQNRHQCRL